MNKKLEGIKMMLIVVFALLICACSSRHSIPDEYKKEESNITGLLLRCHIFFSREGTVPKSIETLLNYPLDVKCFEDIQIAGLKSNDVWKTVLRYESKHDMAVIQSAGKDRIFGTHDDLHGTVELESSQFVSIECKYYDTGVRIFWCFD